MESEKVKEIKAKEFLEILCYKYKDVEGWEITKLQLMNILTLINELESENKKQKQANKKVINIIYSNNEENKQLKDRIAELEKENETKTNTISDLLKKQEFYEKEKLTKFVEKLKERSSQCYIAKNEERISNITYEISDKRIDETLKEFLGK